MKATLIFNLTDEDDRRAFDNAVRADEFTAAISDYSNALRQRIKYAGEVGSFEEARDLLWECLREYGILDLD